jgi:hypothetical protein
MTVSPRMKVGCLFTLFACFCLGIGFIAGVVAHQTWKKKTDDPAVMKWITLKHLEKLQLTAEQRQQIEPTIDTALADLATIKAEATHSVWQVIDQAADRIAEKLNPEQQAKWSQIRPKRPR